MAMSRGLDALLGDNTSGESTMTVRITLIEPSRDQPRKDFNEEKLNELAKSISEHGLIQPIIVCSIPGGTYKIIAGERRFRACKIAGLREVPVIVRDVDEAEIKKMQIIENIQREDLNPVEEAKAFKDLVESFDLRQEDLADTVGKSRSYISNSMRLLSLPDKVLDCLAERKISVGHAKVLLSLKDEKKIGPALDEIITRDLTVRQCEKLVDILNSEDEEESEKEDVTPVKHNYYTETELSLKEHLGRKVKIKGRNGKGTLTLEFFSDEDLTAIANILASLNNE